MPLLQWRRMGWHTGGATIHRLHLQMQTWTMNLTVCSQNHPECVYWRQLDNGVVYVLDNYNNKKTFLGILNPVFCLKLYHNKDILTYFFLHLFSQFLRNVKRCRGVCFSHSAAVFYRCSKSRVFVPLCSFSALTAGGDVQLVCQCGVFSYPSFNSIPVWGVSLPFYQEQL